MHQFTYTSCRPGRSLNGSGGYTVRAASAKTDHAWLTYAPHLARYDVTAPSASGTAPRLAFQRRNNAAIITHSLKVRDHDSRPASFTHAIIDTSGLLRPAAAIGMWGSRFWQCADADGTVELPSIDGLPLDGTISSGVVQRLLQEDRFHELGRFLLAAWLYRSNKPIVIMAQPDKVAAAIWLLANCVPPGAVRDLSFATQDHDPLTAAVAVAGFAGAGRSVPAAVTGHHHWFDLHTGESSPKHDSACSDFICDAARAGDWNAVTAFIARCDALEIADAAEIELLHRVMHESHVCTHAEILRLQHRPQVLRWMLEDARHAKAAISLFTSARAATNDGVRTLAGILSESAERRRQLIDTLLAQAGAALVAGDLSRAEYLVDTCSGITDAPAPSILWQRSLGQLELAQLDLVTRIRMADRLISVGVGPTGQSILNKLLDVPLEALSDVMRCRVRPSVKAEACRYAVQRSGALTQTTIDALVYQPEVLGPLLRTAPDPTAVASVVAVSGPRAVFEVLMTDRAARDRVDIGCVLDHMINSAPTTHRQLASPGFARYWTILVNGRHADSMGTAILNSTGVNGHARELATALKQALCSSSLTAPVASALKRRLALLEVITTRDTASASLEQIITAISELPHPDRREVSLQLLSPLAASIARQETCEALRSLQSLLEIVATHARCGPAGALRQFASAALANGRLLKEAMIATAAIAHAFGAAGQPDSVNARDELVDLGVELTDLYAQAGGPRFNQQVTEQAMRWPEPARTFFRLARQHRQVNGFLRARFARSRAALPERLP